MKKLVLVMALAALCAWILPGCMITDYAGSECTKSQGLARVNMGIEIYTYADICDTTVPGDTFANGMTGIVYTKYDNAGWGVNCGDGTLDCPAAGGGDECGDVVQPCNIPQEAMDCLAIADDDGDGYSSTLIFNDILGNHPDMYNAWYDSDGDGDPTNDSDIYCWDAVGGWWGYFTDDRPEFWTWNTNLYNNPNATNVFAWDCPADMPARSRDCSHRTTTLTCETTPAEMWWGRYCYSYWGYFYSPPRWYSYCYDTRFTKSNCGWAANILVTEETNLDWLPGWDPNKAQTLGPGNRLWATDCPEGANKCATPNDFACAYDGTGAATCFYAFTAEIDDYICDFGLPMDKMFEVIKNASVAENGMVGLEVTGFRLNDAEVIFSEPWRLTVPPEASMLRIPLSLNDPWLQKAAAEILDAGVSAGEPTFYVNGVELSIPAVVTLNPNWLEARAGSGKDVVRNR